MGTAGLRTVGVRVARLGKIVIGTAEVGTVAVRTLWIGKYFLTTPFFKP